MDFNICYNPRTLLESAGVGWLWEVVFIVISIGLVISFVSEIFKIQKGEKPDFAGLVWKTLTIVVLYRYLPDMIEKMMKVTYSFPLVSELDAEFYKAFDLYSSNLSMTGNFPSDVFEYCPKLADSALSDTGIPLFTSFYLQYFFKLAVFLLMFFVWTAKEVIFSYGWGTLLSLNMIGLCFALVFPAFPNRGFASLGGFFRSTAVFSLWPLLYAVFLFVAGKAQVGILKTAQKLCSCPYSFEIGKDTVTVFSGLVFMAIGIAGVPFFASKIAGSEQLENTVSNIKTIVAARIGPYRGKQ